MGWRRQWHPTPVLLPGKSHGRRSLGGLQSMGSLRVGHDWVTSLCLFTFMHWRRKWQPTPVFLPGESQGPRSLVGCPLWRRTESDTTEATEQQQQLWWVYDIFNNEKMYKSKDVHLGSLASVQFSALEISAKLPFVALHGGCHSLHSYPQTMRACFPTSPTQCLSNSFHFCQSEGKVVPYSLNFIFIILP